jgi:hypothetical protein
MYSWLLDSKRGTFKGRRKQNTLHRLAVASWNIYRRPIPLDAGKIFPEQTCICYLNRRSGWAAAVWTNAVAFSNLPQRPAAAGSRQGLSWLGARAPDVNTHPWRSSFVEFEDVLAFPWLVAESALHLPSCPMCDALWIETNFEPYFFSYSFVLKFGSNPQRWAFGTF